MNNVAKSEQSPIQVSAGKEGKRVAMLCEYLPLFDNKGYFITFCSVANNYLFFSRPVLGFKCFSCCNIETPQAKNNILPWKTFSMICHCATVRGSKVEDIEG